VAAPLVTLGLITFNAADSAARALASLQAQEGIEFEIVVVDDASSDETVAILRRSAEIDARIRVLTSDSNGGAAAARNRVIAEAKGEFIVFFDDDDVSAPSRAVAQVERIIEVERLVGGEVVCHTARRQIYPDGSERIERTMGQDSGGPIPGGIGVARRILMGEPMDGAYGAVATCSQAARTALYRRLGGFDTAFRRSQDTEFAVRAARAGAFFAGIAEPLVTQTMTLTSDKSLGKERVFKRMLLQKHADLFDSPAHLRFCLDWTEAKGDWLVRDWPRFGGRMAKLAFTHPLRVMQRARLALPNLAGNASFSRFHRKAAR
jgi:glycosyltransferase involved in cell wall biosynthesis